MNNTNQKKQRKYINPHEILYQPADEGKVIDQPHTQPTQDHGVDRSCLPLSCVFQRNSFLTRNLALTPDYKGDPASLEVMPVYLFAHIRDVDVQLMGLPKSVKTRILSRYTNQVSH